MAGESARATKPVGPVLSQSFSSRAVKDKPVPWIRLKRICNCGERLLGLAQRVAARANCPPKLGGQRDRVLRSREGRFQSKSCKNAALEPPLAPLRLRHNGAALRT